MSRARLVCSEILSKMSPVHQFDDKVYPTLNTSQDKVFNLCFNECSNDENTNVSSVLSEMNTSMDDWLRQKTTCTSMDCIDSSSTYLNDINFLSTRDPDMCSSDVGLELILVNNDNEKKDTNLNYCTINDNDKNSDLDFTDPLLNLVPMNEVLLRKTETKCDNILDGSDVENLNKSRPVWDTLSIASRKSDCDENNSDFADFNLLPLSFDTNENDNEQLTTLTEEQLSDTLQNTTRTELSNHNDIITPTFLNNEQQYSSLVTPETSPTLIKNKKDIFIKRPNILRTSSLKTKSSTSTTTTNTETEDSLLKLSNKTELLETITLTTLSNDNEEKTVNTNLTTEEKMLDVLGITDDGLDSIVTDEGMRMWVCPEHDCGRIFNRVHTLKSHILSHYGLKPFKCDFPGCPWSFYTSFKLKRHRDTHLKRKDFTCNVPDCNRSFTTVYNLNTHLKLHERPARLKCLVRSCNGRFQTRRAMETHLKSHDLSLAPYKCQTSGCTKLYFSYGALTAHMRVHQHKEEELRCKWENCGRTFDKPCRLRAHMRIHTGDKPYVCRYQDCQWAFASSSKLKRHQYKHNNERRFRCTIGDCNKAFMRSEHLREHTFTHIAQRTFQCSICGEKCSAKATLYVHKKKYHTETETETNQPKSIKIPKPKSNNKSCARTYLPYTDKATPEPLAATTVVNQEDVLLSSANTVYLSNLMLQDASEAAEAHSEMYSADDGAEYILLFDSSTSTSFPESTVNLKDLD